MNAYKIEQLEIMLAFEREQPEAEKYGAHLSHWSGRAKPINIDEGAIEALILYYKSKEG